MQEQLRDLHPCGNIPKENFELELREIRKIKGCGSLREDFYTRFIPDLYQKLRIGAVTWRKKRIAFR